MARINFDLDNEKHKELKIASIQDDYKSLRELLAELIGEYLQERKDKVGAR